MASLSPPFSDLSPSRMVRAIEEAGFGIGSEPFALNSYENRVYAFRDEDLTPWVAKFYRPERWSDAAIADEHRLLGQLASAGVPVGDVWRNAEGVSLFHVEGQRLALFPQLRGRAPELDDMGQLFALGQTIGRLHASSASLSLPHRPRFDAASLCKESRDAVLSSGRLSGTTRDDYAAVSEAIVRTIGRMSLPNVASIAVHGDCHPGNILGDGEQFALVDFDDCGYAPAVQDLWMLLSEHHEQDTQAQLSEIIEGYEEYREFDRRELAWIPLLRTCRLMRHSAWILNRWHDPAFPQAFPWMESSDFWRDHVRALEVQRLGLEQPQWLA
ncbi:Serine/threonine protein kinase RdoA [Carnimonas sp. R-84981]|uniref:serine/threonine protein kinase n=1 Tax=Carnimonas bestiolae TaxID=3402172 RepID=UPI003EDBD54F